MPRRTPKTRHGATQPEAARKAKAVLLRLPPEIVALLDELRGGRQRSAYVTRLVRTAAGVDPGTTADDSDFAKGEEDNDRSDR